MGLRELREDYDYAVPHKRYYGNVAHKEKSYAAYLFMKRMLDISLSLCGIIFLLPLLVLVAAWIKIEDPKGKIFSSKIGSVRTRYSFRCTNSDPWCPMLNN